MSRIVSPGSYQSYGGGSSRRSPFFVTELVRNHGLKAIFALIVAALFAFAPLATLYWFNELSRQSVAIVEPSQRVVVKPGRHQQDQNGESPGETALLQVICEIPDFEGYRELLCDDDPLRRGVQTTDSNYVRRELVYLRRAGQSQLPFGLLGKPPISAWLPAGNYEILVIYGPPYGEAWTGMRSYAGPWISAFAECSLENRQKTVCRVPLPHYDWGRSTPINLTGSEHPAGDAVPADELAPFLHACENIVPIPTPAGYLLSLGEPVVRHSTDHHDCVADLSELQAVPREWTRDQLAALRNSLPRDAGPAREKLSRLVDNLLWREFLEGWFCYAAAAVTGLVFTRWGTIAMLEPWRHGNSWVDSLGLLIKIALFSAGAWLLWQVLTDSSGFHGPLHFRIR